MKNEERRTKRYATTAVAVAGLMLAASPAVAQYGDFYTSEYVETDAELYDYYDAGYTEADTTDDWFYDYYSLDADAGTEFWTTDYQEDEWGFGEDEWGYEYETDNGYADDPGEEGVFDF